MKDLDIENQELTALERNVLRLLRLIKMEEKISENGVFDLHAQPYRLGAVTRILTTRHIAANNLTPICLN